MSTHRIPGLTIDGTHTRDRDDSIWLDEDDGRPRISVGITRVADAVPPGGDLDRLSAERGFSRYGPGFAVPMLSSDLSEGAYSLTPGREQPVLAIRAALDADLEPDEVEVAEGVLESSAALSYPEAAAIIAGETEHPAREMLCRMAGLAKALLGKRLQSGAMALYDFRQGWALTEDGHFRHLRAEERNVAYVIVQELMVLANYALARWMIEHDLVGLFRNHRARLAAPERRVLLHEITDAVTDPDLAQLGNVRRRVELLLERARYGASVHGHYALNLPCYTHGTSPLRRRADLVNQRVVLACLRGEPAPYDKATLEDLAAAVNAQYDAHQEARQQGYREKALSAIAAAVANGSATELNEMDSGAFYRAIRSAGEQGILPDALREAIDARLASGDLTPRQAAQALFASPDDWAPTRRKVLAWLSAHPDRAVSALVSAHQVLEWENTEFAVAPEGRGFRCTARVRDLHSSCVAASKRVARHGAALALCHVLVGEPAPEEPEPAGSPAPEQPGEAFRHVRRQMAAGNFIGALHDWCARRGLAAPLYAPEAEQHEGVMLHRCRAALTVDGQEIAAEGEGRSKHVARRQAAQALLEQLLTPPPAAEACQ